MNFNNISNNLYFRLLLIFIALLPLFILRDFTPNNELKYLSIADEAIENINIFAFYNHGIQYADKPPLYIWLVMLSKLIFGKHLMFVLSLISIIPSFVIIAVMDKWTKSSLTLKETISTELMLFTSLFFLASSIVIRMDMLMTMFIVLALYTFYKMYTNKDYRRGSIMLPVYIFMAIFSKGPVGFLVPIISIVVFLLIKRDIKSLGKYLGLKTWIILLSLCFVWFIGVYLDGGKEYLSNLLFNQTVNRAVDSFHHKRPFYYYMITYWYAVAPWSILSFATIFIAIKRKLIKSDLEKLFAVVTFTTLIMMSLVSSKIVIYLLPCFPFLLYLTGMLLPSIDNNKWVKISLIIPSVIFMIILPASFFIDKFVSIDIELWAPIQCFALIPFIGGIVALIAVRKNHILCAVNSISISLLLLLFSASFSLDSMNKFLGAKEACIKAVSISKDIKSDNFGYYNLRSGENYDSYFKEYLGKEKGYNKDQIKDFKMISVDKDELDNIENTLLFIRTKDIERDSVLKNRISGSEVYNFGETSLVVLE